VPFPKRLSGPRKYPIAPFDSASTCSAPPQSKPLRMTAERASPSQWVGWTQGDLAALVLSSYKSSFLKKGLFTFANVKAHKG
jgi:hypothetical protein